MEINHNNHINSMTLFSYHIKLWNQLLYTQTKYKQKHVMPEHAVCKNEHYN